MTEFLKLVSQNFLIITLIKVLTIYQSSILRMSYEVGTSGDPEAQRGEFLGELPTRCHLEVTEPECGPESLAPRPVFL